MKLILSIATVCAAVSANALSISLNPVTTVAPNVGAFTINGTITAGAGEQFLFLNQIWFPFNAGFTAGFNGSNAVDPSLAAWSGFGTYTGAIYDYAGGPGNYGYSGGMPVGLYDFNPGSPDFMPQIQATFQLPTGATEIAFSDYAVNVVPEPASMAALALGGMALLRRRRQSK